MPPRLALARRFVLPFGLALSAASWWSPALVAQELPLVREYPGSGQYECPAPGAPVSPPDEDDRARAAQVASDATQAMALGDVERAQELLAEVTSLDPTSADYAYRHALTLETLGDADNALLEYCRSLALGIDVLGLEGEARDRIDALYETVRARIPEPARVAFVEGLAHADSSEYSQAVQAFTEAIEAAPGWGAPVYNRGVVHEQIGNIRASLDDYRRYVDLAPTDVDPILVLVSERIGQLEGRASVNLPSPAGALALGMVPGMGHYYTGRPMVGTLTLAGAAAALAAGMMFKNITTLCVQDVPDGASCPDELVVDEITERPYLWHGIGVAAAITVVGAVDALLRARSRRDEAEAIAGPAEGPTVSLRPTVTSRGSRVNVGLLSVRFR